MSAAVHSTFQIGGQKLDTVFQEIDQFEWLQSAIDEAAIAARNRGTVFEWRALADGATSEDIFDAETRLGVSLSRSHEAFLRRWNGASLYADGTGTIWFPSITQVTEKTIEARAYWNKREGFDSWERMIVFADYEDGNLCVTDARSKDDANARVLDAFHELNPTLWRRDGVLAKSVLQWFEKVFAAIACGRSATFWITG